MSAFEMVTRPHVENFITWARDKPRVVALAADLTNSCELGLWRDTYPSRYFSFGMAEQNMLSAAGGLAREGYEPFIHTFSVFMYRRAYDQLAMSIAYPNLRVRLLGFLPGVTTPGGVTHQAIEDVAIMRATPNMTVLETGDATEVESVLDVAHAIDGPVYIRILRGVMPRIFPRSEPMVLDRVRVLHDIGDRPDGVLLITAGIETEYALRAVPLLEDRGIAVKLLHVSTHKPFSDPEIAKSIKQCTGGVVTVENHSVIGGLGSAVAEVIAEHGLARRLVRVGLQDTYAHGASREWLLREYGLDSVGIVRGVERLTGVETGIEPADFDERVLVGATEQADSL